MQKLGDERDYLDFMTDMGYSVNLLENLSMAITKPEYREIPIGTFFNMWLKKNELEKDIVSPYNFGVVLGELYCGLVFAKENWIDWLPDIDFSMIDDEWGIKTTEYSYPMKSAPKLRDVVRRIRNSLGHSNFKVELSDNKSYPELFNSAYIVFEDVNAKNPLDTFTIKLRVSQLRHFYGAYRDLVFSKIDTKYGDNR